VATISKFYLHDAVTPNGGTMPSTTPVPSSSVSTGDAAGVTTARDATDVIGTANPDTESTITANANTNPQNWGHRRFVSRPLAARTFALADGNYTWSCAWTESNAAHNCAPELSIYPWRPSTGLRVGTASVGIALVEPGTTETAMSATGTWSGTQAILDGDILVFDVWSTFTQSMAVAYTDNFAYDGTTEASTTTCASFITPPSALTLYFASDPIAAYTERRRTPRRGIHTVKV
jgi:hypothetical protein